MGHGGAGSRRIAWLAAAAAGAALLAAWLASRGGEGDASGSARADRAPGETGEAPSLHGRPGDPAGAPPPEGGSRRPTERAQGAVATRGWTLRGRVLGPDAVPVAGAHVVATLEIGPDRRALGDSTTGPDGTWALAVDAVREVGRWNLRESVCRLVAWKAREGTAQGDWSAWPPIEQAAWEGAADLTLAPGRPVAGRVVDAAGTAVADATVALCDPAAATPGPTARTDPAGRYVLPWPDDFRGDVVAMAQAHGAARRPAADLEDERMPDLVLGPTPAVEGEVRFADGSPVDRVWVWGQVQEGDGAGDPCLLRHGSQGTASADAGGRFRLFLPRAGLCRLWINGAGVEATARTGDRGVVLVVAEHRVRLRIRDPEGRALPAQGLFAFGWDAAHAGLAEDLLSGRTPRRDAHRSSDWSMATSGAHEGVEDLFLPPGTVGVVQVQATGAAPAEAVIRVPAEGNHTDVELVVGRPVATGALRVTCVDGKGAEIPYASVEVATRLGARLADGVVASGHRFDDLPAGPVVVVAEARTGPEDRSRLPARDAFRLPGTGHAEVRADEATDVRIALLDGGRLRVALRAADPPPGGTDDQGNPVEAQGPSLRLVEPATGRTEFLLMHLSETGGAASWTAYNRPMLAAAVIPPGLWRLEVARRGKGWAEPLATAEVRIDARRVTDVVVDLPPAR